MFFKDAPVKIGGWASGSYMGKCKDCGDQFVGDKRAIFCLPCAHTAEIEAEREACAKVADCIGEDAGDAIAAGIRLRS